MQLKSFIQLPNSNYPTQPDTKSQWYSTEDCVAGEASVCVGGRGGGGVNLNDLVQLTNIP